MSPLAFKSNNSRPMRCTTLPDTPFERGDNFLSNECIHTMFPFQIASSQAANQKSSGFCVFRFQTDFDKREHFVLSSLYRKIAFIVICELRTRHPGPTRASIIFSSHWSMCSKRPPWLVMHPFRSFVKACMALATRCWEIWAQQRLRRFFGLSISLIFTAQRPLKLSPDEELCVWALRRSSFRLEVSQAGVVQVVQAVRTLIARQPAGTSEASVDRIWCDRSSSCSAIGFSFKRFMRDVTCRHMQSLLS